MLDAIWMLVERLNRGATDRNRFRFDLPEKSRTHQDCRDSGLPDHLDADIAGSRGGPCNLAGSGSPSAHVAAALVALLAIAVSCCDDTVDAPDPDAAVTGDAPATTDASAGACPTAEIMFTQATGCANDGGVEFGIPDGNAALIAQLEAHEMAISCAPGGGRAGCFVTPNLLLCSYPTRFPQQCEAMHGAMTDDTWQDMCSIAALPEVMAIVHTILE